MKHFEQTQKNFRKFNILKNHKKLKIKFKSEKVIILFKILTAAKFRKTLRIGKIV